MSQSDELRQAAALLEFWFNMEADNETARDEEDRDPEYTKVIKAALTVSKFMRKHLAEHPADDDELVDESWARSVAAVAHDDYPCVMDFDLNEASDVWIAIRSGKIELRGGVTKENPTRWDVRTAAKLFGIKLKEAN